MVWPHHDSSDCRSGYGHGYVLPRPLTYEKDMMAWLVSIDQSESSYQSTKRNAMISGGSEGCWSWHGNNGGKSNEFYQHKLAQICIDIRHFYILFCYFLIIYIIHYHDGGKITSCLSHVEYIFQPLDRGNPKCMVGIFYRFLTPQ